MIIWFLLQTDEDEEAGEALLKPSPDAVTTILFVKPIGGQGNSLISCRMLLNINTRWHFVACVFDVQLSSIVLQCAERDGARLFGYRCT